MHLAANEGHGELVELLLTAGAAVDAKNRDGWGPKILQSLLEKCKNMKTIECKTNVPAEVMFQIIIPRSSKRFFFLPRFISASFGKICLV